MQQKLKQLKPAAVSIATESEGKGTLEEEDTIRMWQLILLGSADNPAVPRDKTAPVNLDGESVAEELSMATACTAWPSMGNMVQHAWLGWSCVVLVEEAACGCTPAGVGPS